MNDMIKKRRNLKSQNYSRIVKTDGNEKVVKQEYNQFMNISELVKQKKRNDTLTNLFPVNNRHQNNSSNYFRQNELNVRPSIYEIMNSKSIKNQ